MVPQITIHCMPSKKRMAADVVMLKVKLLKLVKLNKTAKKILFDIVEMALECRHFFIRMPQ